MIFLISCSLLMCIRFKKNVKLAGIIYLHRISDRRQPTSLSQNVEKLVTLCGSDTIANIVLATTMWGNEGSLEERHKRETDLEIQLKTNVEGMKVEMMRFEDSFISAWDIIDVATQTDEDDADDTRLQQELVELGEKLNDKVGREKFKKLQKLLAANQDILRKLREGGPDEVLVRDLNAQYEDLRKTLQATFDHLSESPTKVSFGRRVMALLYKKPAPVGSSAISCLGFSLSFSAACALISRCTIV